MALSPEQIARREERRQLAMRERLRILAESPRTPSLAALDAAVWEEARSWSLRCSHCCRRLHALGGVVNGAGEYCEACAVSHIARGVWYESKTCPHCITAGVMLDALYCC